MFNAIFYKPLYNALVFLSGHLPGHSAVLAIIVLTVLVKILLLPLYHKAAVTQKNIKKIEPHVEKIKIDHKDNREEQARQLMKLYQENQINPFVSFLVILIQLPIIFALFWVFKEGFVFKPELLYSFVTLPETLNTSFFGLFSITEKSIVLAFLVGLSQYIQTRLALPPLPKRDDSQAPSFKDDFGRSMNMNLKYVMPVFIGFIAYGLSSAICVYWITSNLFSIGQEIYIRKKIG